MSNATLPNTPRSAQRQIEISNWKQHEKNTLLGFFTVTLESGMIIHKCQLHRKDRTWISFPNQEWTNDRGEKKYNTLIEFVEGPTKETKYEIRNRFESQVLAAFKQQVPGVL